MKRFYVTVRDERERTGWLLGPYGTHKEALANVQRGKDAAYLADGWAWFYAYGTAGVTGGNAVKTIFGK